MPIASNLEEAFAFTHEIEGVYTKLKETEASLESVGDFLKLAGELPAWAQPLVFYALGAAVLDEEDALEAQRHLVDYLFDSWQAEQPAAASRVA